MRILRSNLIGPLLWCWAGASAPAQAEVALEVAQKLEVEPALDSARRKVRSAAIWLASGLDGWFGDRPFQDGGKVSDGQLDISIFKRRDESVDFKLRFNARFSLPKLEERTYLFLGRDNPREIVTDKPTAFSRQQLLPRPTASSTGTAAWASIRRWTANACWRSNCSPPASRVQACL